MKVESEFAKFANLAKQDKLSPLDLEREREEKLSGQIIATSHDLGPQKVANWRLVNYYNLARSFKGVPNGSV